MTDRAEQLELYRVMIDTVTANEQRRQQISSVFITLVAAGFGAASAIPDFNMIYVTMPAAFVSLVWWAQVRFLKRLAAAKFHVIRQIEEQFTLRPFEEEWKFLRRSESQRSWFAFGLSDIEMLVPTSVFLVSVAHLGYQALQFCKGCF